MVRNDISFFRFFVFFKHGRLATAGLSEYGPQKCTDSSQAETEIEWSTIAFM